MGVQAWKLWIVTSFFVLAGCTEKVLELKSSGISTNDILGKTLVFGSSSFSTLGMSASAVPCSAVTLGIHLVATDGSLNPSALMTTSMNPDGSYVFSKPEEMGVNLNSTDVSYVLKAEGCDSVYYRPLTSKKGQDITLGSTLIIMSADVADGSKRKISNLTRTEAETAISTFDQGGATTLTGLVNQVIADGTLSSRYLTIANISPSLLKEIPPPMLLTTAPLTIQENQTTAYSVNLTHWNQDYVPAYEWLLDGTPVSTTSSWSYVTQKNSQGPHLLRLRVGTKVGAGTTIDPAKPIKTTDFNLIVSNDFPPAAPSITLSGPVKRNTLPGTVNLATGAAMINCNSFTNLALTEDPFVAPVSGAAYTITCSSAGTQSVPFTLSAGDGAKTIAVWARDASGNTSSAPSTVSMVLDQTNPTLSLSSPGTLAGGVATNIVYSAADATAGLQSVILQYAQDGTTFSLLSDVTAGTSPYSWSVPSVNVTTAKLRLIVTDQAGNSSQVTSPAFTIDSIAPAVTITGPAANTPSQSTITLTGTCETGLAVDIAGTGTTAGSATCVSGTYSQAISLTGADGIKNIIVSQTDAAGHLTTVNRNFYKDNVAPTISLVAPAGGELLKAGDPFAITWSAADANFPANPIKIESSTNNGSSWTTIIAATANSGSYNWTVPSFDTNQFKIRVTATDSLQSTSSESSVFTVDAAPPVITLLNLTGGQTLKGNLAFTINWTPATDSNLSTNPISLESSSNAGGTWTSIASGLANSGSYSWTLPGTSGTQYRVRVKASDQLGQVGVSSSTSNFTIDATAPVLSLTSMTGGQTIPNGSASSIQWSASDNLALLSNPISIEVSTNAGSTWSTLVSGLANSGSYAWTPSADGSQYRLRLTATDSVGNTTQATSAANFTVSSGSPTLTQTTLSSPLVTQTGSAQTFGGACELRAAIGGSTNITVKLEGVVQTTVACSGTSPTGTWSYTTSAMMSDGTRNYTFERTSAASITSSVGTVWIRDNTPPVITSVVVNDGDSETVNTTVGVKVTASDALTGINGLKVRVKPVDGAAGDCSTVYADDSWQDMSASTTEFLTSTSDTLGTKKLCAWAKDKAGNITVMASPTALAGADRGSIEKIISAAPAINTFSVTNNQSGGNFGTTIYALGDPVNIQWTSTSTSGFDNNPLKLEYTTNGSTWNVITQNAGGLSGNPTTYNGSYTAFNAPTAGFFRVRIQMTSKYGLTSNVIVSDSQNAGAWSVYAGSTGFGVGGSKESLLIYNNPYSRYARYAETPNGDLYISSSSSGIVKINGKTGQTSQYIKDGTLNLPNSGFLDANSAIASSSSSVLTDSNGLLYVSSGSKIYQINTSTGAVRFYAGGGSVIDNTATPSTVRISSGRIQFDESNNLYFLADCTSTFSTSVQNARRLMKMSQNADGSPGTVSMVAGNCTVGSLPADGTNALSTAFITATVQTAGDFYAWNSGQVIYFYDYDNSAGGNRALYKILNGTLYSTGLTTALKATGNQALYYDRSLSRLLLANNENIQVINVNLSGTGGDSLGTAVTGYSTSGACAVDDGPINATCSRAMGQIYRLKNGQLSFLENGAYSIATRIRILTSAGTIQSLAGTAGFDNRSGLRPLLRGSFRSIDYKKASLGNLTAFPEGLYFYESSSGIWGKIATNDSVTALWGNGAASSPTYAPGSSISTTIPYSDGSYNLGQFTFDDQGLPWFRLSHRMYSLDSAQKVVVRTSGTSAALSAEGTVGTSLNSMGASESTFYGNLSMKANKAFVINKKYSLPTYSNTEPFMRIYNFATGYLDDLMGGTGRGNTSSPDSIGYEDLANKSIDSFCVNGNCRVHFVEGNPSLLTDDLLYWTESDKLRVIENPTTPGSQKLTTVFTLPAGNGSFQNITVSPDGKYVFYFTSSGASAGKLRCHALNVIDETSWCKNLAASHVVLGPPTGMSTLSQVPNQLTWKDNTTLFMSTGGLPNGEIYMLDLTKLGP